MLDMIITKRIHKLFAIEGKNICDVKHETVETKNLARCVTTLVVSYLMS